MTYAEFAEKHGIAMTWKSVESRPDTIAWDANARHYLVTLSAAESEAVFQTYYSKGCALVAPPEIGEVLSCLALDARSFETTLDYYDWCDEYGYTPSREAQRIYEGCRHQRANLLGMLGHIAYGQLLYETED